MSYFALKWGGYIFVFRLLTQFCHLPWNAIYEIDVNFFFDPLKNTTANEISCGRV
jgi:hypothetical protein